MAKILVTGSSGFIGSNITNHLKSNNVCLGVSKSKGVDVTDFSSLKEIDFKADIIVHCAATFSNDYEIAYDTNVTGTANIFKYAIQNKISRVILISTISSFNNTENEYFNSYGKTKRLSEIVANDFSEKYGIDLTTLRLAQIYDKERRAEQSQAMLYGFMDRIVKDKKLVIYGRKNPLRNYVNINDVIKIIDDCVKNNVLGQYNVVNPESQTIEQVANIIFKSIEVKPNIRFDYDKKDILSIYIPDKDLYPTSFKYKTLTEGITEVLSYGR